MLNIFYRGHLQWACFLLVISALCTPLYSLDGASEADSAIKAVVSPDFDQGFINVSVTNGTGSSIKVSSVLKSGFPPEEGIKPKCIYVCLLFTKKVDIRLFTPEEMSTYSGVRGGMVPLPIEIAPGETKLIKLNLVKWEIKVAKSMNEVKVLLDRDNIAFQTFIYNKIDNIWKIK